eukprot:g1840.t1
MATHGIFLATALLYLLALSSGIRVDQTESLALLRQRDQVSGSCEGCFQAKRKPGQPFEDDCQTEILPEEDFTGSGIVMTGDMTDKGGDDDAKNLKLAHQLKQAAEKAPRRAPQVEILLGNHEFMQFENELRYYNSAMSKKEYRKHLKEFAEESGLTDWPVIGIFTVPFKNEKLLDLI